MNEGGRESCRRRRDFAAALAAEPGPVLAGCLAGLDPDVLDGETRVDLIRAWQRMAAWVDAQQQVALAAVVAATEPGGVRPSPRV